MQRPSISVCMIVKNEAARLHYRLPQLARLFDEVIVVDTGSTDDTRQVVLDSCVHYEVYEWCDDFSAARNYAIDRASGDYVLVIDADESVNDDARDVLVAFIARSPNALGVVRVISAEQAGKSMQKAVSHITRFFPRHWSIRFEGIVHEQVVDQTRKRPRLNTGLVIDHLGYALPESEMHKKSLRNLTLIERALTLDPIPILRAYYLYQRGKSLDHLQRYQEARHCYEEALGCHSPEQSFRPELVMAYLYDLKRLNDLGRLWDAVKEALKDYPDYPDLYFFIGIAMIQLRVPKLDMIRLSFETCLSLGDMSHKYPSVLGVGSYLAAFNLGVFYESQQDLPRAQHYYERAAKEGYVPAQQRLEQITSTL